MGCHVLAALLTVGLLAATQLAQAKVFGKPYVIAHRGASGKYPEHTQAGYLEAIKEGADFIECDVVPTSDCKLICRHEPDLSFTTNAGQQYKDFEDTVDMYGQEASGVFSFKLSYQQVKSLRTRQDVVGRSNEYNGAFPVVTLEEFINIAKSADRTVGIYVETKYPSFFDGLKLECFNGNSFSETVLNTLLKRGYTGPMDSDAWKQRPVFIESFERKNLQELSKLTNIPLVQLMGGWSVTVPNDDITYGDMASADGLKKVAQYASVVAPWKDSYARVGTSKRLEKINVEFVENVHAAGLQLHAWVFRDESRFLANDFDKDINLEYELHFEQLGIDGGLTDFPETLVKFLDGSKMLNSGSSD